MTDGPTNVYYFIEHGKLFFKRLETRIQPFPCSYYNPDIMHLKGVKRHLISKLDIFKYMTHGLSDARTV